jgi:hypothetical protein
MRNDMKKIIVIILSSFILLTVTACNDGNTTPIEEELEPITQGEEIIETEAQTEEEIIEELPEEPLEEELIEDPNDDIGFTLEYSGFVIYMDQDMTDVINALGEPLGIFEAPSCAFDGIDRIFSYPGIQIHTYPEDDEDFVHTLSIRDDSISIYGGIFLGSTWDSVKFVFGNDYAQDFDMFTYTRGQTTLAFLVENDIITAITFGLIMN